MNKDRIQNSVIRGGMEVDVTTAVYSLVKNARCHIVDGKIVEWGSDETQPTEAEIEAEVKRLEKEYSDNQYQRDRAGQYPQLNEQLDLLFHDMTSGKGDKTGEWYKAVNKVKTDNPKG